MVCARFRFCIHFTHL